MRSAIFALEKGDTNGKTDGTDFNPSIRSIRFTIDLRFRRESQV